MPITTFTLIKLGDHPNLAQAGGWDANTLSSTIATATEKLLTALPKLVFSK